MKNEYLTLKELSKELSISTATGKNWLKLNKIAPQMIVEGEALFSYSYLDNLKFEIQSESNKILKSRRNKKYIFGRNFYQSYVNHDSPNLPIVKSLTEILEYENLILNSEQIQILIAECVIQLIIQRLKLPFKEFDCVLKMYLNGIISLGDYDFLVRPLIESETNAFDFYNNHKNLFKAKYKYVENEDTAGFLYMSIQNLCAKKHNGAYYTPYFAVDKLLSTISFDKKNKKIFDSCCGTGNFLLRLNNEIDIKDIFANDIDQISVIVARINLALKYKCNDKRILFKNITNYDFLTHDWMSKFDVILGNPPWGAEFDSEQKIYLKNNYVTAYKQKPESFSLFIEKSLKLLSENGNLSFVLPESILTTKSHNDIRKILMNSVKFNCIVYIGNIFDGVNCPSIILSAKKNNKFSTKGLKIKTKSACFTIQKERIVNSHIFNFKLTDEEYEILAHIDSLKNTVTLKNNSEFALGIVTGDNKKYISDKQKSGYEPILKGTDIKKYIIKEPHNFIKYDAKNFQQCAKETCYRAKEKLLYRFISTKPEFAYDNNQILTLNSCNIVIPKIPEVPIKYVLAVFNSKIIEFYYKKKFGGVKVLRTFLESIPIAIPDKASCDRIISLVDKIFADAKNKEKYCSQIDKILLKLYCLEQFNPYFA